MYKCNNIIIYICITHIMFISPNKLAKWAGLASHFNHEKHMFEFLLLNSETQQNENKQ